MNYNHRIESFPSNHKLEVNYSWSELRKSSPRPEYFHTPQINYLQHLTLQANY